MRLATLCITFAALTGLLLGQEKDVSLRDPSGGVVQVDAGLKDKGKPILPPAITSDMRETYFQAKSDVLEAQVALTAAQGRLDASVKGMQAVCPLIVDDKGKPQCAPPVEPEAKP